MIMQTFYTQYVFSKWHAMTGWKNKLGAVIKGPSWVPGSPWTGRDEDKIDVRYREKFDVSLPLWCNLYVLVHFAVVVLAFQELCLRNLVSNETFTSLKHSALIDS
jgi:alkylglycerol monooxygenase